MKEELLKQLKRQKILQLSHKQMSFNLQKCIFG
jgi:hypothetical protein